MLAEAHPNAPPVERTAPVALEAEASVLGACLIDPDAISKVVDVLDEGMFFREGHRRLFRAMLRLFERGDPVEPTTVFEELDRAGDADAAGGRPYLAELLGEVPTAANVEYHARIVLDRYRLRAVIEAGTAIVQDAHESGDAADAVLDRAEQRVLQIGATGQQAGDMPSLKSVLGPTFDRIAELQNSKGGITGIASGLRDLDEMTGGFQRGDLVIVAARPSMGKTSLVTTFLLHAAIASQHRCALFSLETSKEKMVQRMLCAEALVDLSRMLRGRLQDDDYVRLATAAGHLNTARVWLEDRGGLRVADIRSRIRRLIAAQGELGLIIVDYLQLMEGTGRENRTQDVTEITRGLKSIAKEANAPLIALSQLSRAPEKRTEHRPQLADLRESGSLEQDADLVMFPYRPEYYLSEAEIADQRVAGKTELIIGKNRDGPTGSVNLFFRKESTRFEDYGDGPRWT